jgi:antitoxin ParD1/3/4
MGLDVAPEVEELVESKIRSSRYTSATEVLREALRLLDCRDEVLRLHKEEISTAIDEGWNAAARGELVDGDEVFDRIDAELEATKRAHKT